MTVYQIMIPVADNNNVRFTDTQIQDFEQFVLNRTGGYTKLKEAIGAWQSDDRLYREKMIPYQIGCTESDIKMIAAFAKSYFQQEAIFVMTLGKGELY